MRTITHSLLALTLSFLFVANTALACSWDSSDEAELLKRADAVFVGRVDSIEFQEDPHTEGDYLVTFTVSEVVKGPRLDTVVVSTSAGIGDCGYRFEVGSRYRVFAYGHKGKLSTSAGSGTRGLPNPNYRPEIEAFPSARVPRGEPSAPE